MTDTDRASDAAELLRTRPHLVDAVRAAQTLVVHAKAEQALDLSDFAEWAREQGLIRHT